MTTEIFKIVIKKSKVNNDLENFKEFNETKENFTIINHPLSHFEKGSIKKVNIEEGYIYLGILKPKYQHLKGSGILSRFITKTKDKVIDVFSPRLNDYNNQTKRMLAKYGHEQIISMSIYRTPIPNMINKVINMISLGQWEQLKKKFGFDKFFHLALVLTLKNNKNIIVEKNEVINVSDSYKTNSNTEVLPIEDYANIIPTNINALLDRTRKAFNNDLLYFGYDAFTNNCQVFIKNILVSNGLYNMKINNFLFQDIQQLTKELNPLTKGIMRGTTNIAATVNKLLGKGKKGKFIKIDKGLIGMRGRGRLDANNNFYIFDSRGESNIIDLKYRDNDFDDVKIFNNIEELDNLIGNKWKKYDTYLLSDDHLTRERRIISIITDKDNNYIAHAYTEDRGNTLLIGYVYIDEKYRKGGYCVPLLHLLFEYLKNINLLNKFSTVNLVYTAESINALICYAKVCSYYGYFDRRLKDFNMIGWDTRFDDEQLENLNDIIENTSQFFFTKKK